MSTDAKGVKLARLSTTAVFAVSGAVFGTWTPRIPTVVSELGLSEVQLGLALLGPAVGSMAALVLAGALTAHFGSRRVVLVAGVGYCIVPIGLGQVTSLLTLFVVLLLWGISIGVLDVAMNTAGTSVQHRYGRSILSSMHAAYSAGGFVGVVLGSLAAGKALSIGGHMLIACLVGLTIILCLGRYMLPASLDVSTGGPAFVRPTRSLIGLGLLAFIVLLSEGVAADWSALYMREEVGATAAFAGAGYAAFTLAMLVGRLIGDRVIDVAGAVRTVRVAASLGAFGLAAGLLLGRPWGAVMGFGIMGLGLACLVPVIFSAAAARSASSGAAIAAVSTCGYVGFLAGPPLIGGVAQVMGLTGALALLVLLLGMVAMFARLTAAEESHGSSVA